MRKISSLLIIALLLTTIVLPANSQSRNIKLKKIGSLADSQSKAEATNLGLFGGQAEDIAVDPTSSNMYMTTMAPNGIFISKNDGSTWTTLDGVNYGTGKSVEVNISNGDVYVLIGDSVLKSTDGSTFTDITSRVQINGATGQELIFAQNTLMVTYRGGVSVSRNDGTSFTNETIESGSTITDIASSPTAGKFYAIASQNNTEKLYVTTDYGDNWSDVGLSSKSGVSAGQRLSVVSVNPTNANHVVISNTNGGTSNSIQSVDGLNTWTSLIDGASNVAGNHVTFDSTGRMYIGKFYTDNSGATWSQVGNETPLSSIYGDSFAVDPGNDSNLFTNSNMGLAKSTNRGVSWTDSIDGVTSVKTYDISQADNKKYVWIGANGGLGRTTNFTSAAPDWKYPITLGGQSSSSYAVWVNENNSAIVIGGSNGNLYRTINGNDATPAWSNVASLSGFGNVIEIASAPNDVTNIYAAQYYDDLAGADSGAVYKSSDGGATWSNISISGNLPVTALTVAKDGDVYAGVGADSSAKGVYKYSGGSWSKLSNAPTDPITSVVVDPDNANLIYTTTDADTGTGGNNTSYLYRSKNGGSTWTKETTGLTGVNHLNTLTAQQSTSPNTYYLAGQSSTSLNGVIYKSTDGGNSWSLFYTGLKQEEFYSLLFDGLTVGNDRGLYDIKSKASVGLKSSSSKVKKGAKFFLKISLKDAATKSLLKKRTVLLQKLVGKKWKTVKKLKLNKKAAANVATRISKTTTYRILWKPANKNDKAEYKSSKSKQLKVKVKK